MGTHRSKKFLMKAFLWGLILLSHGFFTLELSAQTYDFDEGIEVLAEGLIREREEILRKKRIAVFGIIESKSKKKWEVSSHIEDGIVDALVNKGFTVIERRRIDDVIKKEIKKNVDWWFDEATVSQFGKLMGADLVVTGRYVVWGPALLKINIRAIDVSEGKILAANKINVLTDRIAGLMKPEDSGTEIEDKPKEEDTRYSDHGFQKEYSSIEEKKKLEAEKEETILKKRGSAVCNRPIAFFRFEGNLRNEGGSRHDGLFFSNPNFVSGILGKALYFDGNDDMVYVNKSEDLSITDAITISAWVYPISYRNHGTVITDWNYYLQIHADGKIATYFYGFNNPGYHFSNSVVPAGKWSHIAVTWDSNKTQIYLDGKLDKSVFNSGRGTTPYNKPLSIGFQVDFNRAFHGRIDEILVFDCALSPAEIITLYEKTQPREEISRTAVRSMAGVWIVGGAPPARSGGECVLNKMETPLFCIMSMGESLKEES